MTLLYRCWAIRYIVLLLVPVEMSTVSTPCSNKKQAPLNDRMNETKATKTIEMTNPNLLYRVMERIESFMNEPSKAAQRVNRLLFLHFPEQFGAANRDFLFQLLYASWPTEISITLESGLYVRYNSFGNVSFYREPGNSGYDISDFDMQKHYTSCIDSYSGNPQNCTMDVGRQYVKCIDDCALVKCSDATTQGTDCSNITSDSQEGLLELQQCQENIKWCQNYEIKSVSDGEKRGYIPETGFCINERGLPEERDGYVLKDAATETFGNCYFLDRTTKVNRALEGNFAYCGSSDDVSNGKNSSVLCNNTFYGGFIGSLEYNPRVTDWYKMTKQFQQPLWSDPYYLHDTAGIGFTYSEPIYSYERYDNQTRVVFNGAVSVSYYLNDLDNFLREQFSGTKLQVIVVEKNEPNYVVASSHGSDSNKVVSIDPNSTSDKCTISNSKKVRYSGECTSIRTSIMEFNFTANDRIYQRAFLAHKQFNFKNNTMVSFTESNTTVGANAYMSDIYVYIPQGSINLNWYILTVYPMSRSDSDTAQRGDAAFTIACTLAAIGFVVCFWLFALFYKKRNETIMIEADWRFTCAFVFGCTMLNLSTFTLLGESTDSTCMLRMWSFHFLFASALSPLYVKVYRMYTLLEASKTFSRKTITNTKACLLSLPIVLAQTVLLLIFTFVDPSKATEELQLTSSDGLQTIRCEHNSNAFFICQLVFDALLLATGCYLAVRTWDLDPKFGEAKPLAFCMYNITLTGTLIVLILNLVDMENESRIMLVAFGILWGTVLSSTAFVLPRYMKLIGQQKELSTSRLSRLSLVAAGIPSSEAGLHQVALPVQTHEAALPTP